MAVEGKALFAAMKAFWLLEISFSAEKEMQVEGECGFWFSLGPCGDMDVATRACTWMCAFWRVPAETRSRILRRAIKIKPSHHQNYPQLTTEIASHRMRNHQQWIT
jgi:hypothetical protein